ncbi:DinB family protein [Pontibacter ummariensis]|uniref:DinB superfamily protein n=1 Tax=Pontibacter ummariensis TaxID=1610492 RepID=A0A239FE58_9BACT|nr:DinB family protein [Pontibacter ummariensis]PRY12295.1 DinB family protein [Pontibacter ummariensis]SNS55199.1 DinB superfamily protein [Pontibacter ummariensis]
MNTAVYSHIQLMNPKLEEKYLRLEKCRNMLLDELEGLDDALLNSPPAEGKWSINQTMAHLVLVERRMLDYVQYKLKQQEAFPEASFSQGLKSLLLKLALQSGKKFKAPDVVATVPDNIALATLRQEWDEVRFRLEDLLTELPVHLLNKCLFKHPVAGPLTMFQTLTFVQDHFNHHLRQIQQQKQRLLV